MTDDEIAAIARQTAAALEFNGTIEVASTEEALQEMVTASVSTPACSCQHVLEPVTADAVARADAPVQLSPQDGMAPAAPWEAACAELTSRIAALENRLAAFESDISRLLVESTSLLTIG